jgi:hypothetical protein
LKHIFFFVFTFAGFFNQARIAQASEDTNLLIAKTRFTLGLNHVSRFVFTCLANPGECQLSDRESRLANAIYYGIFRARSSIIFLSEREQPGTFQLDGQVRIAKTGNDVGDDIYVNTDLIVHDGIGGLPEAISFAQVFAVLVHELGHHHHNVLTPIPTHEELDTLGNKVRAYVETNTKTTTVSHQWPALNQEKGEFVQLEIIESRGSQGQLQDQSHLFVTGPFGVVDVSDLVVGRTQCPRAYYLDELDFEGRPILFHLKQFEFDNLVPTTDKLELRFKIEKASVWCINELPQGAGTYQVFDRYTRGYFELHFESKDAAITFNEGGSVLNMVVPPDTHYY